MNLLINILLAFYVTVALLMILVILMQRPKSEGLGAAFGGGVTENIFGAQTTNVLTKITSWLATIFFLLTFGLSILYAHKGSTKSELRQELMKNLPPPGATASPIGSPGSSPTGTPGSSPAGSPSPSSTASPNRPPATPPNGDSGATPSSSTVSSPTAAVGESETAVNSPSGVSTPPASTPLAERAFDTPDSAPESSMGSAESSAATPGATTLPRRKRNR